MKISRYIALILAVLMLAMTVFSFPMKTEAAINPVQDYFLRVMGSISRANYYNSNVLASLTLGQAIYESGWGRSTLAVGACNLFGLKAFNSWSGKVFNQRDLLLYDSYDDYLFASGQAHANTTSAWRAHSSWAESAKSHNDLFLTSDRYTDIVGEKNYVTAAKLLVSSGYCTDYGYAESVIEMIEGYDLTDYDNITPDSDGIVALVADADRKFLDIGDTFTLGITYYPSSKRPSSLKWSSDNKSVATVDSNGKVKAVGHGTALITATLANGREACCIVYVDCNATIIESDVNVRTSASTLSSSKGILRRGTAVKVTSTSVTVNSSGEKFYSVKGITTAGNLVTGYVHEDYIYLSKRDPVVINVVKDDITLTVNEKYTVYNLVTPSDSINQSLTWKSSNTSVATVDQNGVITAKKTGTAYVTASTSNGSARKTIKVTVASAKRNYTAVISAYQSVLVRSAPSPTASSVGSFSFLDKITVIGEPQGIYYKVTGTNSSGKTLTGYTSSIYVRPALAGASISYATANSDFAVYSSPSASSRQYASIRKGSKYAVLGKSGNFTYVVGLDTTIEAPAVFGYALLGSEDTNYTVSYDANGGFGGPSPQIKKNNVNLTLSSSKPTCVGFTFLGWSENPSAVQPEYASGAIYNVNADTVLYAIWKKNSNAVTITKQPVSVTARSGQLAVVNVTALGEGLTYKWYFKNKGASSFSLTTSYKSDNYSIKMDSTRAGRQVYCVITDKYGNSVKSNTVTFNMGTPLAITKQPVSVTVKSGKEAKATVTASGEGLTYKWYFKNKGASSFSLTTSYKSNNYSITMDSSRAGRQVYCVITDKFGTSVKTNTVTLNIETYAKIIKQPVSVVAPNGTIAKTVITAVGDGLTYKWYFKNKGASSFSLTTSYKSDNYNIVMDSTRAGRQVYCVITDKYGNSVKSNTVTLNMGTPLKITAQPTSVSVYGGENAKVTVTAVGEGLTYKWYFKNKGASSFSLTTSYKSNNYSLVMDSTRAGRQVYCVITDKFGNSVKTNTVSLNIMNAVKITKQPASVTVKDGEIAKVTLAATGDGLTYKWYYKNRTESKFYLTTSFNGPEYSTQMNSTRAGRQIYCIVSDKYGNSIATNIVSLNKR